MATAEERAAYTKELSKKVRSELLAEVQLSHKVLDTTEATKKVLIAMLVEDKFGKEKAEQPKERINKRPYISYVEECLENGTYTRKEIIDTVLEKFPTVVRGGIQTFVTDLKNPKYNHFKERVVATNAEGKLQFQDKVPVPEVIPEQEVEPSELPAE